MKILTTHTLAKDRDESRVSVHNLGQIGGKQAGTTEACSQHVARSDSVANSQDGLKCEYLLKILKTLFYALAFCLTCSACLRQRDEPESSGARAGSENRRWGESRLTAGLTVGTSEDISNQFSAGLGTQMMNRWNSVIGGLSFFRTPSTNIPNQEYPTHESYLNDGEFGIYWHSTWFFDIPTTVLAITTYRGVRRQIETPNEWVEIIHADIVVNGLHSFSTDRLDSTTYHLPSVLLHELGHFVGLLHQLDGRPAVMAPSLSRVDSYDTPFLADNEALSSIYSPSTNPLIGGLNLRRQSVGFRPKKDGQIVEGWIELHEDGECRHYQNRRLLKKHSAHLREKVRVMAP